MKRWPTLQCGPTRFIIPSMYRYGTDSIKNMETRHKISVDIRIFFTAYGRGWWAGVKWSGRVGSDLLADEDVVGTSADVARDATAPDEPAATSDGRRASVLVVAAAAAHRAAVGLAETPVDVAATAAAAAAAAAAASPPDARPAGRRRTVVRRALDVDELFLADPSPAVASPLPLPSPSPRTCQ